MKHKAPKLVIAHELPSAPAELRMEISLDGQQAVFLHGLATCYGVPARALALVAVREWVENRMRTLPGIVQAQ